MSAQNEGPQCQVPYHGDEYIVPTETMSFELPKPNYNLKFFNKDHEEVATLDFNGPGLAFEGIADEAAIVFMDWISQAFIGRLKDERNKVRTEMEAELLKLKQGVAANSEYIQGRWDLIGEFQDIIREGIEQ